MRRYALWATLLLSLVPQAEPVLAELSVRECILNAPSGKTWRLPPDGVQYVIGTLDFNNTSGSDLVVTGTVSLSEGNAAGTFISYHFKLDGTPFGGGSHWTGSKYPDSHVVQGLLPNVGSGTHTLQLLATNQGAAAFRFDQSWITPLLVDSGEQTATPPGVVPIHTLNANWQTIATQSVPIASSKMVYVRYGGRDSHGDAAATVEYRVLRAGIVIHDMARSVGPGDRNVLLGFFDENPGLGNVVYSVQARRVGPGGFGNEPSTAGGLGLQTVPVLSVLNGSAASVSIPGNHVFHTVASSGWRNLAAASIGPYGTRSWGLGRGSYSNTFNNEALWQYEITDATNTFEVGVRWNHGAGGQITPRSLANDWEVLGFNTSTPVKLDLKVKGMCQTSNLGISDIEFDILVLPDTLGYATPDICAIAPQACCSNFPSCLVYQCTPPSLSVLNQIGLNCPFP